MVGERAFYRGNAIYRSSSSALVFATFLKALAERTFFSPGYGRVNPVASYQSRWLTVFASSESGVCCLPAKISAFFFIQPALRALTAWLSFAATLGLISGLRSGRTAAAGMG